MLQNLRIQNFAIIDDMEIDLHAGLQVLLGETGAGKSIIVEALSLLKGTKSSFSKIKDENKNAIIEGTFVLSDEFINRHTNLKEYLEGNSNELVITRVLTPNKTSKARINGETVSLSELKEVMEYVIDIHSQGENYLLFDENNHLIFLDYFDSDGKIKNAKEEFNASFKEYKRIKEAYKELYDSIHGEDREYLEYQRNEIAKYNLEPNEIEDMEKELQDSEEFEDLKDYYQEFKEVYDSQEGSFEGALMSLKNTLRKLCSSPISQSANLALDKAGELDDALSDVINEYDSLDFDPARIEYINSRLYSLKDLRHKYGTKTSDILDALKEIEEKISNIDSFELDKERLESNENKALETLKLKADKLSAVRHKAAQSLEKAMNNELESLGLLSGGFKVYISKDEIKHNGQDLVRFMLALNKGSKFLPLKEAASGGENSRLMLALKALFNRLSPYDVIIFDEIDTGVSGSVANKVGDKIKEISNDSQTIVITHLAQVAAKGDCHYLVSKNDINGTTVSNIKIIDGDAVVYEIARMISGENVTEQALSLARELIM